MFMGPRNRFQGMNSASLYSLAGRDDNPIPPRFLAPIDFLKIPAQDDVGVTYCTFCTESESMKGNMKKKTYVQPNIWQLMHRLWKAFLNDRQGMTSHRI
jgi:hypothetical protein